MKKELRKRKNKAANGTGPHVASPIVPKQSLRVDVVPGGISVEKRISLEDMSNTEKLIKKDLLRSLITGAGIIGLMPDNLF
jgi:hypothetical protein